MLDLPAICHIAHQRGIPVAVDNTWGSGYLYNPLKLGADVSVIAATKYLCGHSDVMMGIIVANQDAWEKIGALPEVLGQCSSPDDAALVLRGARTLAPALRFMASRPCSLPNGYSNVAKSKSMVPALEDHPGHELWERDCTGSNGLLTVEFKTQYNTTDSDNFINSLTLFGIGASWGALRVSYYRPMCTEPAAPPTGVRTAHSFVYILGWKMSMTLLTI